MEILQQAEKIVRKKGEKYFADYNRVVADTFCILSGKENSIGLSKLVVDANYTALAHCGQE